MIRVVTVDRFEAADVEALCRMLHQAFGVGCEIAGHVAAPEEAESNEESGAYDAHVFVEEAPAVKLVADDKLLYVTRRRLLQPEGPQGRPPTFGFAEMGGQRAVVSTSNFPKDLEENSDEFRKRLAKQAVREIGRTWGLHSCLDAKCSMHPPWTAAYETHTEPVLCNFCRERSEVLMQIPAA